MLLTHVRTNRFGRQSFPLRLCGRTPVPSRGVATTSSISPRTANNSLFFSEQGVLECISRTSCSTYSRLAKQAGNSGCGSSCDGELLIVIRQAFLVSFQA